MTFLLYGLISFFNIWRALSCIETQYFSDGPIVISPGNFLGTIDVKETMRYYVEITPYVYNTAGPYLQCNHGIVHLLIASGTVGVMLDNRDYVYMCWDYKLIVNQKNYIEIYIDALKFTLALNGKICIESFLSVMFHHMGGSLQCYAYDGAGFSAPNAIINNLLIESITINGQCKDNIMWNFMGNLMVSSPKPVPFYQLIDAGSIECGQTVQGVRESYNIMPFYKYISTDDYDVVYLEGCDSTHDIWLYLFSNIGEEIYNKDDQFGYGNAQGSCGNADAGDITITTIERALVVADQPNVSPKPINVYSGDIYYFGVGQRKTKQSGPFDYTLTLFCNSNNDIAAKLDPQNQINDNNDYKYNYKNEYTSSNYYNKLFLFGIIAFIMVVNTIIYLITFKYTSKPSNNK